MWTYVHGAGLAPDALAAERKLWSDVILLERLRSGVARINPHLPPDAVQRACDLVLTSTSPAVVEDHRSFHELLLAGVPVWYRDEEGEERNDHARLVEPARSPHRGGRFADGDTEILGAAVAIAGVALQRPSGHGFELRRGVGDDGPQRPGVLVDVLVEQVTPIDGKR